ncbi:MAG: hypothetical protein KA004_14395 [Verrucomicrobiales bacterium]|nr:hypothetical protein [Verrucomicrobiales bacterium]
MSSRFPAFRAACVCASFNLAAPSSAQVPAGGVNASLTPAAGKAQTAQPADSPSPDSHETPIVQDPLRTSMKPGWTWVREHKDAWKLTPEGLQILVEPGNMWGPANDAKNILLHRVPEELAARADVRVTVAHQPKKRWEQANLVWFYSGSTMVKLGLEIENGVLNIVMGREENDATKTIAIIPFPHPAAELRFTVKGTALTGHYRQPGGKEWKTAGTATLPSGKLPPPHASVQCYQGEANSGRWATVRDFQITACTD